MRVSVLDMSSDLGYISSARLDCEEYVRNRLPEPRDSAAHSTVPSVVPCETGRGRVCDGCEKRDMVIAELTRALAKACSHTNGGKW